MKFMTILFSAMFLLVGCNTTDVTPDTEPIFQQPARLKIGMTESEVRSILGEPKRTSSNSLETGEVIETWFYRHLVREWQEIRHTDFETIEKVNALTGEIEEVVVPVESTVTRSLHQELTIKIMDGKVISLDSKMDGDMEQVLD